MAEALQTAERSPAREIEVRRSAPSYALTPFDEMERWFDRLFEEAFPRGWFRPFRREWPVGGRVAAMESRWPNIDLIERDEDVVLRAEMPGVAKENLEVSTAGNTVTIKGTPEATEEKGEYYRCEIADVPFTRTVILPVEVNDSQAKATFKNGVLTLILPKAEHARRHTITVQ